MVDVSAPIPSAGWRSIGISMGSLRRHGVTGLAVVSIPVILVAVGIFSVQQAVKTATDVASDLLFLSPYLVAAFALGGYLKAASVDVLITRVFRGRAVLMIFAATAVGALTPLCSCSVAALVAVLLKSGTPLSAVMSFWIASPIISPDLYVYTAGVLGLELATARLLTALFMGVSAGVVTLLIESMGGFRAPMREAFGSRSIPQGQALMPKWLFWKERERVLVFTREFKGAAAKILPWMVLAFTLESLMTAYVPTDFVAGWVGGSSSWAIPLSILVSVPTYANPVAAVPLIAGLLALGMTKPAALAFLAAGSVTTIPAMMAVLPLVRFRVFLWHIAIGLITAGAAAYLYQLYLTIP
jgi:uncharacterized membrane protein YraQ (UPF0718 family)